jgi:hypothetical protein
VVVAGKLKQCPHFSAAMLTFLPLAFYVLQKSVEARAVLVSVQVRAIAICGLVVCGRRSPPFRHSCEVDSFAAARSQQRLAVPSSWLRSDMTVL